MPLHGVVEGQEVVDPLLGRAGRLEDDGLPVHVAVVVVVTGPLLKQAEGSVHGRRVEGAVLVERPGHGSQGADLVQVADHVGV